MRSAAVRIVWTREEVAVALDAVRASNVERGRTQALRELKRAEKCLEPNGGQSTPLWLGEKPLGLVATVLIESQSVAARSALAKLEKEVLTVAVSGKAAGRAASEQVAGAPKDATGGVGMVRVGGERKVGDSTAVNRKGRPWKA